MTALQNNFNSKKKWTDYKITTEIGSTEDNLGPQCMLYAMRNFEAWARKRKFFAQCSSESADVERSRAAVCRTKNMVENLNLIYNRFTKCFELPPKFFFLVISSESGFILNAFAPGMDIGLGQLTKPGIDDVSFNWDQLTAPLKNSNSPYCAELKTWLNDLQVGPSEAERTCAFVATPKNPARNLLYSLLLHQQNRTYYSNLFSDPLVQTQLTSLLKTPLTEEQKFQLIDAFSILTYNMGYDRLSGLLKEYLGRNLKATTERQIEIDRLNQKILNLKSELPALNLAGETKKARQVRSKIAELEEEYLEHFEELRKPILNLEQLNPLQTKAGSKSFWAFLKDRKESHYVDLILGRVAHVDGILGNGVCTQKESQFLSPELSHLNSPL